MGLCDVVFGVCVGGGSFIVGFLLCIYSFYLFISTIGGRSCVFGGGVECGVWRYPYIYIEYWSRNWIIGVNWGFFFLWWG